MKTWDDFLNTVFPDKNEQEVFVAQLRKLISFEGFSFFESHGLPSGGFVGPITFGDRISGNGTVNKVGKVRG